MHLDVPLAWRAFPEAAIPALRPFQGAAGIQCEQRWWDADHVVGRRHLDGQMVDETPALRRVHPDGDAGKSVGRELRHPADAHPVADGLAAHETADEAGSAQEAAEAEPYKPDVARSAA